MFASWFFLEQRRGIVEIWADKEKKLDVWFDCTTSCVIRTVQDAGSSQKEACKWQAQASQDTVEQCSKEGQ